MADPARPDVVLFLLDQLSARWLDAAMDGACAVPNFRRLARRGASLRRCISSNPVCCPARATLATGMTSRQHGVLQNGYRLDESIPTFMRTLQQAGWRTGAFGKVHLHPHFAGVHPDYRPFGFDVAHNTEDPRAGEWLDWVARERPEHLDAALATIWAGAIPELADYGPRHQDLARRIAEVRKGFRWATERFPGSDWKSYTLPFPAEVSQTEWITRHAERFIAETPAGTPLLAHVGYVQPHSPFCPPAECMDLVDRSRVPPAAVAEWFADGAHAPDAPAFFRLRGHEPSGDDWALRRWYYFADLAHLDAQLGRVLAALESAGRLDNRLVILLADHGELLGDHGLAGKGEFHYDACIRVPLILAGPGIPAGVACDRPVQLEDIAPTILDAAQLPVPALPVAGPYLPQDQRCQGVCAGRSLLPLLRGEVSDWPDDAYVESYNNITSADPVDWARTVVTDRWRYTRYPRGGGEQLFDLIADPDEQHNRAADASLAAVRQEMQDRLLERLTLQDHPHPLRGLYRLGVH